MKILVTGASGFIGRNFLLRCPKSARCTAVYFSSRDFPSFVKKHCLKGVRSLRCDLRDPEAVKRLFVKDSDFDVVVYLAANSDPSLSMERPREDLCSNAVALINLLSHCRAKKIIYFSSGAVYHGLKGRIGPSRALNPVLPYAISKLASEQYIKYFHKIGRIKSYVTLRFFGGYGPYEPKRKIFTRLIQEVILKGRGQFTIRGDGRNLIDVMYVDDVVRAILKIIHSRHKNLTVDFADGKPLTINELVKKCLRVLDRPEVKVRHIGKTAEYIEFLASNKTMRTKFGFLPSVSLEKGLLMLRDHIVNKA